jgi:tetratricopeptide repeat protein 30
VGSQTEGVDVRSVGNSMVLEETALVEAFNLKAAIEFQMKNFDAAKEALSDMPPRAEEELDPVSLHNTALMSMEAEPSQGFRKLNFLVNNPPRIWMAHATFLPRLTAPRLPPQVNNPPCPPETFPNLLLLYCKHQYYDLAADVLAENAHLTYEYLTGELYEFLDATLMVQVTPAQHTPSAPRHHSTRHAAR